MIETEVKKANTSNIIKIESQIDNCTIYIIEGALMKHLLGDVLSTKKEIFTPVPLSTEDFIQEFKEKFMTNMKGD